MPIQIGGANIWFKREELAHTGAHKINNAGAKKLIYLLSSNIFYSTSFRFISTLLDLRLRVILLIII